MSLRVGTTHDMICHLVRLVICFTLQFPVRDKVLSVYITSPSRGDFTTCKLTIEEKEKFLSEHNKFRGMVNPPAADMEYLVGTDRITGKNSGTGDLLLLVIFIRMTKFPTRTRFHSKCVFCI